MIHTINGIAVVSSTGVLANYVLKLIRRGINWTEILKIDKGLTYEDIRAVINYGYSLNSQMVDNQESFPEGPTNRIY